MKRTIISVLSLLLATAAWSQETPTAKPVTSELNPTLQPIVPLAAIEDAREGEADNSRYVIAKAVMVTWSKANDTAWGFSKSLGRWAKQEIDPPAEQPPKINDPSFLVSDSLALWRVGSTYYAFSGQAGRWDVLRLAQGHTPKPVVEDELILVHDEDNDHTFAASTGRWTSPNDGDPVAPVSDIPADKKPEEWSIKVVPLNHAKASDAERVVRQVILDRYHLASDERTNALVVSGFPEVIQKVENLIKVLDHAKPNEPPQQAANPGAAGMESSDGKYGGVSVWPPGTAGQSSPDGKYGAVASPKTLAALQSQYDDKERQARAIARQIRDLQVAPNEHKPAIDELKTKLQQAVAEAFAARHQLQQAEAADLQERLAGIQRNLQTRQQLRDKIIENRVKDLLDPDLQWNWQTDGSPRLVGQASRLPGAAPLATPTWPGASHGVPTAMPAPPGTNTYSTTTDLAAVRNYRNTLGTRFNQVNELFLAGRVPSSEVLRAATEFAQAEFDAGANAEERWAARRQAVDRFKEIKLVIDSKFEQGVEPNQSKLAVDAALIKAESELAAASSTTRSLEPVPVHWQSRQMEHIIWNVLGVRVQQIAPQSVVKNGYRGGLLVDEIRTDPQPSELREGDIILGLHIWETITSDELAWVLMQPISKNVAILNPRDRTSPETAVIRILRDGQPLQFQIKLPPPLIDLMRTNFPRGSDAKSATTNPQSNSTTSERSLTPNSTITIGSQGDTATIRSPDDFRRRLGTLRAGIASTKATSLSTFAGGTDAERAATRQKILDNIERDLAFLREEFAAQLKLLELEVQDAESALASASQQHEAVQHEINTARGKRENLFAAQRAVQEAKTRLQRAKTLLDLYKKADPQHSDQQRAAAEPEPAPLGK